MKFLDILTFLLALLLFSCSTEEPDPVPMEQPVQTLEECIAENVNTLQSDSAYMALQENWARWRCQDISDYSFIVTQGFGISPCRQAEFKVVVQDSVIISTEVVDGVTTSQNCIDNLVTLDGLFDFINVAVDETVSTGWRDPFDRDKDLLVAFGTNIVYDETYGFPTSMFIDYVRQIADEELYVSVRDFEVL